MEIRFLGGAGTVTGSKHLLTAGKAKVLVDCGMFQGLRRLRRLNWKPLPVDPRTIDAMVLTHAHIDHSGYLPVLVRDGFRGRVHCTEPTRELVEILLLDSAKIQEEEAEYANRKGFSKHKPAKPLYTADDARRAIARLETVPFEEDVPIGEGATLRMVQAGHILGAGHALLRAGGRSVLFSGDIGRPTDPLMFSPDPSTEPDYVVMESTYGARHHDEVDPPTAIARVARRTLERGGVLLIPSFAVGRAQLMLHCLHRIMERGEAPRVPIYINSPMATDVTELYVRYAKYHKLSRDETIAMCRAAKFVNTVQQSKDLNEKSGPMVIISASGMLSGGRVVHHLKRFGPEKETTILLPGFQAPGTRGHAIANGAKRVKVHGQFVKIAAEVEQLDMFSAHADQDELVRWIDSIGHRPRKVFLVHGAPEAADALRVCVETDLKLPAETPDLGETVSLG